MVKRAKLTLGNQAVTPEGLTGADENITLGKEAKQPDGGIAQKMQATNLWKLVFLAVLTLVSLVIFRRKIF